MVLGEIEASTASSKCALFSSGFQGVFNCDQSTAGEIALALGNVPNDQFEADIFTIADYDVERATSRLKLSFNPGPDRHTLGITEKMLSRLEGSARANISPILANVIVPNELEVLLYVSSV